MMVAVPCLWRVFRACMLGLFTAQWNTERPLWSLIRTSAPWLWGRRNEWLSNRAAALAVFPSTYRSRVFMHCGLAWNVAQSSGVRPVLSRTLTFAPNSSRISHMRGWLPRMAYMRGVRPPWSR